MKGYALLILLAYIVLMLIGVCIRKGKMELDYQDLFGTMMSFPCSAHEDPDLNGKDNYNFRPLSKIVFAMIFTPCLSYLVYEISMLPSTRNDVGFNLKNTTICSNVCIPHIEAVSNKVWDIRYILNMYLNSR